MAKLKAYVAIEETVREIAFKAIEPHIKTITEAVKAALDKGDYVQANYLIESFHLTGLLDERRKYLREVLVTALVFGQSQIVPSNATDLVTGMSKLPPVLDDSIDQLIIMVENQMVEAVQQSLRNEVGVATANDELTPFSKADNVIRVNAPDSVANYTRAGVGTRANLITSRLVSFGFLSQAMTAGVDKYQISEVLDDRTCPVCKYMHGHVFEVEGELDRLTLALQTKDVQELKSLAPWPSQTKAGLKTLYGMSSSDLKAAGYSVPPFHPMCRGILVKTGTTTRMFYPSAKEMETGVPEVDMDWLDSLPGDAEVNQVFKKVLKGFSQEKIRSGLIGDESFDKVEWKTRKTLKGLQVLKLSGINGDKIQSITRTLTLRDGEVTVGHEMFRVSSSAQGGGVAKSMLKQSFKLYEEMGVSKVTLEANINVGGYAWAKYGFLPDAGEWEYLRKSLTKNLDALALSDELAAPLRALINGDDPKAIWVLSDSIYGKNLLLDTSWEGYIDLKDEQAMARFRGYISK